MLKIWAERNAWSFVDQTETERFLCVVEAQRVQRTRVWRTDNYLDALIESNGAEMVIEIAYLTSSLCRATHNLWIGSMAASIPSHYNNAYFDHI